MLLFLLGGGKKQKQKTPTCLLGSIALNWCFQPFTWIDSLPKLSYTLDDELFKKLKA